MTERRGALWPAARLALLAASTTWCAMLSWRGFTERPEEFLLDLVLLGLVVAGLGAVLRWRRVPGPLVLATQAVAGLGTVSLLVSGSLLPGDGFTEAVRRANQAATDFAAPVPSTDQVSVQPLLVLGGFAAMLLVDFCGATLRRVPLAGLPLLAVYSVPVSMLGGGLAWWIFALTAVGFLAMLFLQEEEQLRRWGRSLDGAGPDEQPRRLSGVVRASALRIGLIATAAAVVLPQLIPTLSLSALGLGGDGEGGDGISVTNPLVDLRRDLTRGEDVPLITIRTNDPSPDHLRVSVLNRFNDNEFSSGDRQVPTSNLAEGEMPPLQGVDDAIVDTSRSFDYQVEVGREFESRWLPTQSPLRSIEAEGDWRYDPETMDFLASSEGLDARGLSYSMTSVDPRYDVEAMLGLDVDVSAVPDELTALPDGGVSSSVTALARQLTEQADSDYARAVILQRFFRETGGFTYDLGRSVDPVGVDELEAFLDPQRGRRGYCEQFAAAMAVMARVLDIPSRVAVGFLEPEDMGDGTFVYSSYDFHAWVELYFPGAGWVLFDPTPGGANGRVRNELVPANTRPPVSVPEPTTAPTQQPSAQPTGPSAVPSQQIRPPLEPEPAPTVAAPELVAPSPSWLGTAVALLLVALLTLLVLGPRMLRARQRERRLAGGPESVWEELRATCADLRLPWPSDRTPRETRAALVGWLGRVGDSDERPARGPDQAPAAASALGRIVERLERSRYARSGAEDPEDPDGASLRRDAETCLASLEAGATPRVRRRATWLPRSVGWRRTVSERDDVTEDREAELAGGRVDHL